MRDQSRIIVYDTTLRDGAQTEGITFSAEDKLEILRRLQSLGVDLIEGGWPGSNPTDDSFFESAGLEDNLVAFGSTRRSGCSPDEDITWSLSRIPPRPGAASSGRHGTSR